MRKIPFKNYVILGLVFLFTIGVVFYARDWYNTTKEYYMQNSVMKDAIREIKGDELSNFILENQKFILYVASGKNMEIKDFENKFKDLIQDMDLNDLVLYMNLDDVDNNRLYDSLKSYAFDSKVKNQINSNSMASMYVFTDSKITDVLSNVNNYSMNRLETVIDRWDIR